MLTRISIFFAVVCRLAMGGAAEVISIDEEAGTAVVRQSTEQPWKVGDSLCLSQDREKTRCGTVIRETGRSVVVRLQVNGSGVSLIDDETAPPKKNKALGRKKRNGKPKAQVRTPPPSPSPTKLVRAPVSVPVSAPAPPPRAAAGTKPQRAPAAAESPPALEASAVNEEDRPKDWNLSGGIGVGPGYLFPFLQAQKRIAKQLALGLGGLFFLGKSDEANVSALGAMATFDYYFTRDTFRGFVLQGGATYYRIWARDSATSDSSTSLGPLALLGWRAKTNHSVNLAISAGGQYLSRIGASSGIDFSGLKGLLLVDVGMSF